MTIEFLAMATISQLATVAALRTIAAAADRRIGVMMQRANSLTQAPS